MKISIIVPVYNVSKYLKQCITSVLDQDDKDDFELILVDDGSTDGSGNICDFYAQQFSPIKTIHKKNGGLVSAWKMGVNYSSRISEYVLFIDPDDWISPSYLKNLKKEVLKYRPDMIISSITDVYKNHRKKREFIIKDGVYDIYNKKYLYSHLINNGGFFSRGLPVNRWGKLIRKSLLEANMKLVDDSISFGEDLNLFVPLVLNSKKIVVNTRMAGTYYYRFRNDSMLQSYDQNMWNSVNRVYSSLFEICKNQDCLLKQVKYDYIGAITLCYKNNLQNPSLSNALRFVKELSNASFYKESLDAVNLQTFDLLNRNIIWSINTNKNYIQVMDYIILKKMKKIRNTFRERI